MPIKNVIFDLGGVVMDIDFKQTATAFRDLGWDDFLQHINQFHITELFEKYEVGKIDDDEFITGVQALIGRPVTRQEITTAWNALLIGFPPARIEFLKKIKTQYRTFLLSNTNAIHHEEFQQRLLQQFGIRLEDLFEKTYYSHTANLRKPGAAIFELVLRENQLLPEETLFVDDTATNFPEAKRIGIQVWHLEPGTEIMEIGLG